MVLKNNLNRIEVIPLVGKTINPSVELHTSSLKNNPEDISLSRMIYNRVRYKSGKDIT